MYLSISSYTWLPSSFLAKLPLLPNYGIEAVEIFATPRHLDISDPEQVQQAGMMIRDLGFRHISMHAPSGVGDLSSPYEIQRDETVMACQSALDSAMLMGARMVTFHPSSIEGNMSEASERWDALLETLKDICGYAEDRDLRIAIENFPKPMFGSDPLDMYQRIADLDIHNVGMCLDIGHTFVGGHLPEIISEFGEKIFSVHASDNRGRVDEHLPPGQGCVPWKNVMDGLRKIEFQGPIVVEVRDGRRTEPILEDIVEFAGNIGLRGVGQLSH